MAQDDIYGSKAQWESIKRKISNGEYLKPDKKGTFYIKNKANIKYFKQLISKFDSLDISFIRRRDFFKALRKVCYFYDGNLKAMRQQDVENILTQINKIHNHTMRRVFVDLNKQMWKWLFPEKDSKGRPDNSIVPHAWRIKVRFDPSLKTDKSDKLTDTEYIAIQRELGNDPRMQLFFSMLYNNLARPQELCYIDLEDVEVFDNYSRIRISKHGKEGTKTLQLVDNYGYLVLWLNKHPFWKKDGKMPLFITLGNNSRYERLNPKHANKILHTVLKRTKIVKPITNYSFKRNGVTAKYIAGDSPQDIQKTAGWTSTNQLKTYDLSEQQDFFEKELIAKGIIKSTDKDKRKLVQYKVCAFCNEINQLSNEVCNKCNRLLDREAILKQEQEKDDRIKQLEIKMASMKDEIIKSIADELRAKR